MEFLFQKIKGDPPPAMAFKGRENPAYRTVIDHLGNTDGAWVLVGVFDGKVTAGLRTKLRKEGFDAVSRQVKTVPELQADYALEEYGLWARKRAIETPIPMAWTQ